MKNPLTKKLIIIGAVVIVLLGAVLLVAFLPRSYTRPTLTDGDDIFYERLDENGDVLYSITKNEVFEQIKANNGIQQLMMMVDADLLSGYFNDITEEEINDKIKELTYGTDDDTEIAEIDEETRVTLEEDFARSMLLSGYENNRDAYIKLLIAREKYAYDAIFENLTETDLANGYTNQYFDDIVAINIRFTSREDALDVLEKFHLAKLEDKLVQYKGFIYRDETLMDNNDFIVEAYETVEAFYFDENDNILDLDEEIIYTKGEGSTYTDSDQNVYTLNVDGDLVDDVPEVIVNSEQIHNSLAEAEQYKTDNTFYYFMNKTTNNYDLDATVEIRNGAAEVVFTVESDGTVYDSENNDVTNTHNLIFNKVYRKQSDVSSFSSNNTIELTDQEVLNKYIEMYNYVYGEYRTELVEFSTVEDLIALDNEYLNYNFKEVSEYSSGLATYMFKTISSLNEKVYANDPTGINVGGNTYYYMIYKVQEAEKINLGDILIDYVEQSIVLPESVSATFVLPTTGEFGATINWVSADKDVISDKGVVITPAVDTIIEMRYTIRVLGSVKSGGINVRVLTAGENAEVQEITVDYPTIESLINDDTIYQEIKNIIAEDRVYGANASTNVNAQLVSLRREMGLQIYDNYLEKDYLATDKEYISDNRGDKTLIASLEKTLTSEEGLDYTVDEFYLYSLTKNPSIYTLYAAQFKELLYSNYYLETFGEELDISENNSDRMDEIRKSVENEKSYYLYYKSMYEQFGMEYPHDSFLDYVYSQHGTKTEKELLEYYVTSELRPYLINDVVMDYEVPGSFMETIQDNYENYFSLDVTQLLIFIDFDEDGSPDDFNEYRDALDTTGLAEFNSLLARLETTINDYEGNYESLVSAYAKATRENETWGEFKTKGILLKFEDLNFTDQQQSTSHSVNYSGEYGVKDQFIEEFTQALIDLYQLYISYQNPDLDELESDLILTEFGLHLILVEKGDDFEQFSAKFTLDDENASEYDERAINDSDIPSLSQLQLYAEYKLYSVLYDLNDPDVEFTYGITVPKIPESVKEAIEFYAGDLFSQVYVLGTVNIEMANLLIDGNFYPSSGLDMSSAEIKANLQAVQNAYLEAILGDFIN